jgi:hypothetical protein
MKTISNPTHRPGNPPLHVFHDETWRDAIDALSDHALIEAAIAAITPPKVTASSSFILHAPLELAARAALLPMVNAEARHVARERIAEIALRYVKSGDAATVPAQQFASSDDAFAALAAAFETKSADAADAAITHLAANASVTALRHRLTDAIAPLLSAAGHAPILLAALPVIDQQFAGAKALLRAPVRALAKASDIRLTWHLAPRAFPHIANAAEQLQKILAAPPRVMSDSNSIAPTVLAVEKSGDAARLLAPLIDSLTIADARRVLLRIAAWSMLQDDPKQAPYGWTHCLTLPQALLQNADASQNHSALIAIAATEVLGMRATEGNTDIDTMRPFAALPPAPPMGALAAFAASHHDAHVAKYTLACFQAAADDPEAAPLFMAAAAYLHNWWRTHES